MRGWQGRNGERREKKGTAKWEMRDLEVGWGGRVVILICVCVCVCVWCGGWGVQEKRGTDVDEESDK